MSIFGYTLGLILLTYFRRINTYNYVDFLEYLRCSQLNIYYIYIAYKGIVGLLLILIPLTATSYEIVLNFKNERRSYTVSFKAQVIEYYFQRFKENANAAASNYKIDPSLVLRWLQSKDKINSNRGTHVRKI